jgi:hypothetical protein
MGREDEGRMEDGGWEMEKTHDPSLELVESFFSQTVEREW